MAEVTIVIKASDQASQPIKNLGKEVDTLKTKVASAGEGFGKLSQVMMAVAGATQIPLTIGAIVNAMKDAIVNAYSLAAALEQSMMAFTSMLGSTEKATAMLNSLRAFADKTPFQFMELQGAAKRMMAYGFAARDVLPMLTAVGDAASALGGGGEMIDRLTRALGQMQAKGKVSGEELRQLAETGIPALKMLADNAGVTTAEMGKMIEKGLVPADKAIKTLIAGMKEEFGGLMAKQAETATGKLSTMKDSLANLSTELGRTSIPTVKRWAEVWTVVFNSLLPLARRYADFITVEEELIKGVELGIIKGHELAYTYDFLRGKVVQLTEAEFAHQKNLAMKNPDDPTAMVALSFLAPDDDIASMLKKVRTAQDQLARIEKDATEKRQIELQKRQDQTQQYMEFLETTTGKLATNARQHDELTEAIKRTTEAGGILVDGVKMSAEPTEAQRARLKTLGDQYVTLTEQHRLETEMEKTHKQTAKELEAELKLLGEAMDVVKGIQMDYIKQETDLQKNIADTKTAMGKAEIEIGKLGGGTAKLKADTDKARLAMLGIIDAQSGYGNSTTFVTQRLGALDTKQREILGTLHTLHDKRASGVALTAEETAMTFKLGEELNKIMPLYATQHANEQALIDDRNALHTATAELTSALEKEIAANILSGETTDASKEKMRKYQEQMDLNNQALLTNSADSAAAKNDVKLLGDGFEDTAGQLKKLEDGQKGNAAMITKAREEYDKLKAKLAEYELAEKNLTKKLAEEMRVRIFDKELLRLAGIKAEGDTQLFSQNDITRMQIFRDALGLKDSDVANSRLNETIGAQLMADSTTKFQELYGEDMHKKGLAYTAFTDLYVEKYRGNIVPTMDEFLKLYDYVILKAQQHNDEWNKAQSREITLTTIFKSVFAAPSAAAGEDPNWKNDPVIIKSEPLDAGRNDAGKTKDAPKEKPNAKGAFATGGAMQGGNPYLVGEMGPELFVPHTAGNIISNQTMGNRQGMSGGGDLNIGTVILNGVKSTSELYSALQKEARARGKNFRLN